MEQGTGSISQMRRLRHRQGRDLSEVTVQPGYLRELKVREARLDFKDLPMADWVPSAGMEGTQREGLPPHKWMRNAAPPEGRGRAN